MDRAEREGRVGAGRAAIRPVLVPVDPTGRARPDDAEVASLLTPPQGRVALVSSGHRGLGLRVVRALAELGMRVVLGSRYAERARAAIDLLGDLANRVAVRALDITDADSVARTAYWLQRRLGRCDVLVNNVAGPHDDDPTTGGLHRTVESTVVGTRMLTDAVTPLMRMHRYGRIVNVCGDPCDTMARRGHLRANRICRSAIGSLTRTLADDLVNSGILVNTYCPRRMTLGPENDLSSPVDTLVRLATLPDDGPTGECYPPVGR